MTFNIATRPIILSTLDTGSILSHSIIPPNNQGKISWTIGILTVKVYLLKGVVQT